MEIVKRYSYKQGEELIQAHNAAILPEIELAIANLSAVECLVKIPREESKLKKWGVLFSPPFINLRFRKDFLEPQGWLKWDARAKKYVEPRLRFSDGTTARGADRFRKMDGIKDRVGLEIQMGKYAFMGYDVFSKMTIFKNAGCIDYGIEIVVVQDMLNCMSTGVSAFEHLMIDFQARGEADIDIPVVVLGIGPTTDEWEEVKAVQKLFKENPLRAKELYPSVGKTDLKGSMPGPSDL